MRTGCVKTELGDSDCLTAVTRVYERCVLFPILFALAIDWVSKKAAEDRGIQTLVLQQLSDLDFPADIAA